MCRPSESTDRRTAADATSKLSSSVTFPTRTSKGNTFKSTRKLTLFPKFKELEAANTKFNSGSLSPPLNIASTHCALPTGCRNSTAKRHKAAKAVRFAPPKCDGLDDYPVQTDIISKIKPSSSMSLKELQDVYWQSQDFEIFTGTARYIAAEIRSIASTIPQKSSGYDSVMSRSYDVCSRAANDVCSRAANEPLCAADSMSMCLPPRLFMALTNWVKAGHSRRGLERWCVPHHMNYRPLARKEAICGVLKAQEFIREQRRRKVTISTDEEEQILRKVSETCTRAAKLFGVVMGHADAAAVGQFKHEGELTEGNGINRVSVGTIEESTLFYSNVKRRNSASIAFLPSPIM